MNAAARMRVMIGLAALAILAGPRATAPTSQAQQATRKHDAENTRSDGGALLAHAPQNRPRPEAAKNVTPPHSDDRAAQLILDLHNGQTVPMNGIFSKKTVMTEDDFLSLQRGTHGRRPSAVQRS